MGFELLSSCLPDIQTQKKVGDLWPRKSLQLTPLCNTPHLHTAWSSYSITHIANNSCFRSGKHTCISQLPCLPSSFSCKRTLHSSSIGSEHLLKLKFRSKSEKKAMRYGKRAWAANPPQVVSVHQYRLLSTQVHPQIDSSQKVTWLDRGIVTAACIATLHGMIICCCCCCCYTVSMSSSVIPVV